MNIAVRLCFFVLWIIMAFTAGQAHGGVNAWTPNGLEGVVVTAIAIDPANPSTIFVGTQDSGVYKSTNGGVTWAASNTGMTYYNLHSVNCFAIDPTNSSIIYAGTDNTIVGDYFRGGVYKSIDGGANWLLLTGGWVYEGDQSRHLYDVYSLAIDPANPSTLWAGTQSSRHVSHDGGTTWSGGGRSTIYSIAIDPVNPLNIYAAFWGAGLVISNDGGANWQSPRIISSFLHEFLYSVAIDPTNPSTIYVGVDAETEPTEPGYESPGGVFKSTDGGANWTSLGLSGMDVWCLSINPVNTATLYTGTLGGGVFRSSDGGTNWTPLNTGLASLTIYSLAIDPGEPNTLYAATVSGIFKYTYDATAPQPSTSDGGNGDGNGGCFIATAAFGSSIEPHVMVLRAFRDQVLSGNLLGRSFVSFYYKVSPPIADFVSQHEILKMLVRWGLIPLVGLSWMALNIGPTFTLGIMLVLTVLLWKVVSRTYTRQCYKG